MSRQRTIWEKTRTLCPPASSLGSSLSISTSLPAAWIIACSWKSSASGLWHFLKLSRIFSSAPERKKGKGEIYRNFSGFEFLIKRQYLCLLRSTWTLFSLFLALFWQSAVLHFSVVLGNYRWDKLLIKPNREEHRHWFVFHVFVCVLWPVIR